MADAAQDGETGAVPTQAQMLAFVAERWPDRCGPDHRAMKVAEEAGEVVGAVVKMSEGRKTKADVAQETAQLVMVAMALAESVGFDLAAAIADEWADLATRQWPGVATQTGGMPPPAPSTG